MKNIPSITFKDFIKRVEQPGFQRVRQKGSHIRFVHSDGRKITIPDHGNKDVSRGLLVKIIRYDLEITVDEFFEE
jgi:predicted RNA binding protein YcfA (HicA-like mRNA interferase family)